MWLIAREVVAFELDPVETQKTNQNVETSSVRGWHPWLSNAIALRLKNRTPPTLLT